MSILTDRHVKAARLSDLPDCMKEVINDYEKEVSRLLRELSAERTRRMNAERTLRYTNATVHLLRWIIKTDKHILDMKERLKRKGVASD